MKLFKLNLSIFLTLLFCIGTTATTFSQPSLFSYEKYSNGKGDTLNYRLLVPDWGLTQKFPLVIFLHGSGERGKDNDAQLKWGVMNFATDQNLKLHPSIVIAPQCPENLGWANLSFNKNFTEVSLLPTPTKQMELLIELIKQTVQKLPVDTTRIYITGLSMGGFGTFDAIERYPNLFAAAVPVCGAGDVSKAKSINHIPIWIFHGADDGAVNPSFSTEMFRALTAAGAKPGFTQYPEVGHFSWIAAYSDPLMMEWLFRQRK